MDANTEGARQIHSKEADFKQEVSFAIMYTTSTADGFLKGVAQYVVPANAGARRRRPTKLSSP